MHPARVASTQAGTDHCDQPTDALWAPRPLLGDTNPLDSSAEHQQMIRLGCALALIPDQLCHRGGGLLAGAGHARREL